MNSPLRSDALDLLRGTAMLWMTFFHFSFDLANAGYTQQNFYTDPLWTVQRTCILSLFLLCAGAGQALALQQGQSWGRFGRRCLQIALCAGLVTAGSMLMFPGSYIYFGVLQGMVVMLIIVRLTAHWGNCLWGLGLLAMLLPHVAAYAHHQGWLGAAFNAVPLNVLGLISSKPITEDYVPIFPWLGVMWWGMAGGQWWARHQSVVMISAAAPSALRPVALLGRWSLSYYMLHQPVLLGGLWGGVWLWSYVQR